jgi:hypothetical protein
LASMISASYGMHAAVTDTRDRRFELLAMPRLSRADGHRAAAIVYRRDKHVINLLAFVSNDRSDAAPNLEAQNGFNIVR